MINYDQLESNIEEFSNKFSNALPFEHIVIDNFCDEEKLSIALDSVGTPEHNSSSKSRDYVFAKNKFEKSQFDHICEEFKHLKNEILSKRFEKFLFHLTGQNIFIDETFHGGGLHQGASGSFLDMHADFNYHPINPNWFRNINLLIYLNKDWKKDYKGQLKIINGNDPNSKEYLIDPIFNRAVIMFTREYTLHGYDKINFPQDMCRTSLAAYGYSIDENPSAARTTVWFPENSSIIKRYLGKHMPKLVKIKSKIFGSGTQKKS